MISGLKRKGEMPTEEMEEPEMGCLPYPDVDRGFVQP